MDSCFFSEVISEIWTLLTDSSFSVANLYAIRKFLSSINTRKYQSIADGKYFLRGKLTEDLKWDAGFWKKNPFFQCYVSLLKRI